MYVAFRIALGPWLWHMEIGEEPDYARQEQSVREALAEMGVWLP